MNLLGRRFAAAMTLAVVVGFVMTSTSLLAGQAPASRPAPATKTAVTTQAKAASAPTKKYVAPRTENGQPDLNGVWAYGTATPLQRGEGAPAELSDEEADAAAARANVARHQDNRPARGTPADVGGAYNDFWW